MQPHRRHYAVCGASWDRFNVADFVASKSKTKYLSKYLPKYLGRRSRRLADLFSFFPCYVRLDILPCSFMYMLETSYSYNPNTFDDILSGEWTCAVQ